MNVFISHISEEANEAKALKAGLEAAIPGITVFVSSSDIVLGDTWLVELLKQLDSTQIVLTLCSPGSVRQPWINFENGIGYAKKAMVIPICYKGLTTDRLPDPLAILQTFELTKAAACRNLVLLIASNLKLTVADNFDSAGMLAAINQAMQVKGPLNKDTIGVVLSHRQDEWRIGRNSIFNLPDSLPDDMRNIWKITGIKDERSLNSQDLYQCAGLILAMPWRVTLHQETINALVEWVYSGGRLLLLGFELGDRHHESNLAELSHRFGIDPTSGDIVGPRVIKTDTTATPVSIPKPYGEAVVFKPDLSPEHRFNLGMTEISLRNVQTVRVDPGGKEWIHVGDNASYRPRQDSVQYNNGVMATPGLNMVEQIGLSSWLPVAVEAPKGLCGKGGVNMIGTWDLMGNAAFFDGPNLDLLTRLLDWLSHKEVNRGQVHP